MHLPLGWSEESLSEDLRPSPPLTGEEGEQTLEQQTLTKIN